MYTIGVVVEGPTDKAAIPELVKKCRKQVRVVCRPCGGSIVGRLRGIFDELYHRAGVDKLVAVCDADGNEPPELRSRLSRVIAGRPYRAKAELVVAVQCLEAWLLADEAAVQRIGGKAKKFDRPETLADPKTQLRSLLSQGGIDYNPEVARRIAETAKASVIARRCPSFEEFRGAILDC